MSTKSITYVCLLRGINVGGNGIVSMADLKAVFVGLGFTNVGSYINSGNLIFSSTVSDARKLESMIESEILAKLKMDLKVVVRSRKEITEVLKHLPKDWEYPENYRCDVIFLRHEIDDPELVNRIAVKEGVDEVSYFKGTIFWSALKSEITKSKATKLVGTKEYKFMTIRTLRTVRKLEEMMS
jgi:uncharacterized protein (DUF1697 family)